MSDIYNRIVEQSDKLGISGTQLGDMLGLKKSPMTDWKNKKSSPTLDQVIKMCDIFATSADYLLFGYENNLTANQLELLRTYNSLDSRGQHRVHTIIYEELDRISKNEGKKK